MTEPPLRCTCGRLYRECFDVAVADPTWDRIAPRADGGVLCAGCMHDRLVAAGLDHYATPGCITSGPMAATPVMESAWRAAVGRDPGLTDADVERAVAAYNAVWQSWGPMPLDASTVDECRRGAMRAAISAYLMEAGG